jgi:hypothetical protein
MSKILLALLFSAAINLPAQELLFSKTISETQLPVAARLGRDLKSHYISTRYVSQADFLRPRDFFIAITPELIVRSRFIKIHRHPAGSISYEGRLEGAVTGQISFSKYNDRTAGLILMSDGRKYIIDQSAPNIFSISLLNESVFAQRENISDFIEKTTESHRGGPGKSICDAENICPSSSIIDMMIVYTQQAEDNWGGAANTIANITQAVTNMNISMSNSGINNVTFRLVYTEKVSYTESGDFATDLSRLSGTNDGYMDHVHALRDQYGADLVSLVIGSPTGICGISYLNTSPTSYSAANAFNVSLYSCVVGNFTLAHECGHGMGLRHDWYVDANTTPCSHHHGYVNQAAIAQGTASPASSRWRTIMAYNNQCVSAGFPCTRINMWSNPTLTYNGDAAGSAIGTAQPSDEAYAFYRMACLVAAFRSEPCPGPYDISTNGSPSGAALIDLNVNIKGTISPKNDIDHYKFAITNPGTIAALLTELPANYGLAILDANETQIAVSQNNGTQNEMINITVTAGEYYAKVFPKGTANNATSCYTLKIQTGTASDLVADGKFDVNSPALSTAQQGKINSGTSPNKIVLYPNPASNQITIQSNDNKILGELTIYDASGKKIYREFIGSTHTTIDVKHFPSGFYYIRSDQLQATLKFVKQ